jgi:hypothetical protein
MCRQVNIVIGLALFGSLTGALRTRVDSILKTRCSYNKRYAATIAEDDGSVRLQKARLRLAEAQGIIPIGASENPEGISLKDYRSMPSQSKVREISWRVAEPAVKVTL